MADYLPLLLKDPSGTLKPIKPTNPILKEVFQAIPEEQRRGVAMPDRGHALKAWLEQWALDRQRGESRQRRQTRQTSSSNISSSDDSSWKHSNRQ